MSDTTPQTNTLNKESSPNERLYTTATPIRFAPRGPGGNVVMLDPRNVQQWQLDAYKARLDETASQVARYKDRVQELESLVEDSVGNHKAEEQAALRDEIEMLRQEFGKMMIAQQQAQEKKKEGWFPWKASLVVISAGVAFFSGYV